MEQYDRQEPSTTCNTGALEGLLGGPSSFQAGFPTEPVVFRRTLNPIQDFLSARQFDAFLQSTAIPSSFLNVAIDNGAELSDGVPASSVVGREEFAYNSGIHDNAIKDLVDPTALAEQLRRGASVHVQFIDRLHPQMATFARRLGAELGVPLEAHAFYTPPESRGFDRHYDRISSFIVQVDGTKHWELYKPVVRNPLIEYHPWPPPQFDDAEAARVLGGTPDLTFELCDGDILWLPRGWIHNAYTGHSASLHVAIGVPAITRHSLAKLVVEMLAECEPLRDDLPPGFWRQPQQLEAVITDFIDELSERVRGVDVGYLGSLATKDILTRMQALPARPLASSMGYSAPKHGLRFLRDQIANVQHVADSVVLRLGDRDIEVPAEAWASLGNEPALECDLPGTESVAATRVLLDVAWQQGIGMLEDD